jgi:hypothetical protein
MDTNKFSITNHRLKKAIAYEQKLDENFKKYEPVNLPKNNPYLIYANQLRLGKIASETRFQIEKEFKNYPLPPNIPIIEQTPKIKFVENHTQLFSHQINNLK